MVMKRLTYFILTACLFCSVAANSQAYFNVKDYGARPDSQTLCTDAIRTAIDAAAKQGGGTIYFPAGKYLTGAIHLKSNITLFVDAGAEIHFSDNFDHYLPMVPTRYEGVDIVSFSPLLYAYEAENIAITGRGILDGHGKKWWDFVEGYKNDQPRSKWQLMFDSLNKGMLMPDDPKQFVRGFLRPAFIQPMYCKNILIQGVTIRNSPFWTVNPQFCDNVTVHAATVTNPARLAPNTDGINPESCSNVRISDCFISVGDDCITIKSGKDAPGRKMNRPAENYSITNCTMLSGHGGVVIGSEMSGGVKNITISNCIFDGTDRGIRLKTTRGRGNAIEDIRISNIVMKNIRDQAIVMDMEYAKSQPEPVSERTPAIRNIHISGITAYANEACYLNGLAEMPVEDITITDAQFYSKTGMRFRNVKGIELHQVRIDVKDFKALSIENGSAIHLEGLRLNGVPETSPVITVVNSENIRIVRASALRPAGTFVEVKGALSKGIELSGNWLGSGARAFSLGDGARPTAVMVK